MITIEKDIFEVDTMEAFYGNVILVNNNLVIPYINIGLSKHILNKSNQLKFLDYSYIIAEDISYLKLNKDAIIEKVKKDTKSNSLYLGGVGIGDITGVFDIEIQATKLYLMCFEDYKLADIDDMWKPISTSDSESNMSLKKVNTFIRNMNLAPEIKRILKNSFL